MRGLDLILLFTTMVVLITISAGLYLLEEDAESDRKRVKKALRINLSAFIPAIAMGIMLLMPSNAFAATGDGGANGLAFIAAALSTGMATIGTGYAVGTVGSAALGAVSEDSKILGKTLIFVGLAEGIAIYGLIISIMILGQI